MFHPNQANMDAAFYVDGGQFRALCKKRGLWCDETRAAVLVGIKNLLQRKLGFMFKLAVSFLSRRRGDPGGC